MKKFLSFGPVLITIAAILWALDGVIRRSLYSLPPIIIVFYEHLIGFLIILPFLLPQLKKAKLTGKDLGLISFIALFASVLGTLWFTTALQKVNYISFSVVFLIQKLQPIFAISAAAIVLKEKIDRRYLKWAALALVAAYFVTFKDGFVTLSTGEGTLTAALYALGAAVAWASTTVFSKMALARNSSTVVTGLRFAAGSIFALIGVFWLGQGEVLTQIDPSQFLRFVFIALSTGMVALYIYYQGLRKTEAKITTLLELTFPMLAVFIDVYFYNTILAPTQYLAAAVLMFAMYRVALLQRS